MSIQVPPVIQHATEPTEPCLINLDLTSNRRVNYINFEIRRPARYLKMGLMLLSFVSVMVYQAPDGLPSIGQAHQELFDGMEAVEHPSFKLRRLAKECEATQEEKTIKKKELQKHQLASDAKAKAGQLEALIDPSDVDLSGWSLRARLKIRRAMKEGSRRTDLWQFTCVLYHFFPFVYIFFFFLCFCFFLSSPFSFISFALYIYIYLPFQWHS